MAAWRAKIRAEDPAFEASFGAFGYNVGYLNLRLYQMMGPAGLFNTITSGDNGVAGVKGYEAGPGMRPCGER
jgi:hypothetical protein